MGGYDEGYPTAQDYDLWARVAESTEFANLPEPLRIIRTHAASSSTMRAAEQSRLARGVSHRLLERYLARQLREEEAAALRALLCAYNAVNKENLATAIRLLEELVKRAKGRENSATWRWARREIGTSLLGQAYYRTYSDSTGGCNCCVSQHPFIHSPSAPGADCQVLRLALRGFRTHPKVMNPQVG